jgi:hypothetical protein
LRKITLTHPRNPPWWKKIKMTEQDDSINLLLEQALTRQRDEMMENFSHILQRLSITTDTSSSRDHFGGTSPFKVQVNFYIPIFEGQIDADALEKWLNLLEGYFSVHNFSDREKITFALLKALPHVKHWWETYWEKSSTEESGIYGVEPTWDFFVDAVKEQYYPVGNYDDQYMRWTTLHQERGQAVSEFTNTFHTLHTKLGIKYSERHLVLKYRGALHRYIQTEMEFLTSHHWELPIDMLSKSSRNLGTRTNGSLGLQIHNNQSMIKTTLTNNLPKTSPSHMKRRVTGKTKKDTGKWCDFHKIPWHNTDECRSKNHWW